MSHVERCVLLGVCLLGLAVTSGVTALQQEAAQLPHVPHANMTLGNEGEGSEGKHMHRPKFSRIIYPQYSRQLLYR